VRCAPPGSSSRPVIRAFRSTNSELNRRCGTSGYEQDSVLGNGLQQTSAKTEDRESTDTVITFFIVSTVAPAQYRRLKVKELRSTQLSNEGKVAIGVGVLACILKSARLEKPWRWESPLLRYRVYLLYASEHFNLFL